MAANPALPEAPEAAAERLNGRWGEAAPQDILRASFEAFGTDGVVTVSSFGADSAVLLHMVAGLDRAAPVAFLDTGHHFGETLSYRDDLVGDLGLTNLRIVRPLEDALSSRDPQALLHRSDTDACCDIRKVEPMARAVEPFKAWFTGRKRFQASTRSALGVFEAVGPRLRINPLANWTTADLADYMGRHRLRENPLVAYGYLSIGCFPCTQPVSQGADPRSGRWAGQAKTECGIHLSGLDKTLNASH